MTDSRTPNTPANGGQILTWQERMPEHVRFIGTASSQIDYLKAEIADLRASLAAPAIPTVDRNAVLTEAMVRAAAIKHMGWIMGSGGWGAELRGIAEDLNAALKSAAPASVPATTKQSICRDARFMDALDGYMDAVTNEPRNTDRRVKQRLEIFAAADAWRAATAAQSSMPGAAQPAAKDDEPTDREALIASLEDDAAKLSDANPDDEMAQTMREAAVMLESDGVQPAAQVAVSEDQRDAARYRWLKAQGFEWGKPRHAGVLPVFRIEFECSAYGWSDGENKIDVAIDAMLATPATVKTAEKSDTQQEQK